MIAHTAGSHRSRTFIGIDVSKATLDVAGPGFFLRVANNREGFVEMLAAARKLKRRLHFICEATGSYSRPLVAFLHAQRRKITVISGFRARQFAKTTGRLAKTDQIDAIMLADFGRIMRPAVTDRVDRTQRQLQCVIRRRRQLINAVVIQKTQMQQQGNRELRDAAQKLIDLIEQQIATIDKLSKQIIRRSPLLESKLRAMCSVSGIGAITAIQILSELPEIGKLDRYAVTAIAGLAPYSHDTGVASGARHISGGRALLRRSLYMAAFNASRQSPVLAPFFRRLRARGKPYRVAMVAVMRKLLIRLNHVVREFEIKQSP